MTINNCELQSFSHRQAIYSSQWLNLCAMMHVMYNVAFTATDVPYKILIVKVNYLKCQVVAKLLTVIK